jgi:hypothetical protein
LTFARGDQKVNIDPMTRHRLGLIAALVVPVCLAAQPSAPVWTAADDHRHTMEQIGIQSLRPGPSANEQYPTHANYDEAKAIFTELLGPLASSDHAPSPTGDPSARRS